MVGHQGRRTPTGSLGQSSRRVKDQAVRPWRHCLGASLSRRCGRPVGVGFSAVPQMASPASSLSRSALKARDALVLEHLALADAIAAAAARRLFPLVERVLSLLFNKPLEIMLLNQVRVSKAPDAKEPLDNPGVGPRLTSKSLAASWMSKLLAEVFQSLPKRDTVAKNAITLIMLASSAIASRILD